ncbi:MAG TPA: acetate--CoA ligase family protein, partial [Longimicrobiales bacterium]
VQYGEWLARPQPEPVRFSDVDGDRGASIIAHALSRGNTWLDPEEVRALLQCYGIAMLEQRVTNSPSEAAAVAAEWRRPVALKAIAPSLLHKSDAGGVLLNLKSDDVQGAAQDMEQRLRAGGHSPVRFLIQPMAQPGAEMLIGMVQDPRFGPLVACGAGGVAVELLKDVAVRLAPLSLQDAQEMLQELKTFPLLHGYRGAPPKDTNALIDILLRVGQLAEDAVQVVEMDLNPVLVHESGASVVDARIRIALS